MLAALGDSHDGSAEETDTDHEHPARDSADTVDEVTERNVQVVLSEDTVGRVEEALVGRALSVLLLGVDLVQILSGNGGGIHVDKVEVGRETLFALWLGLGNLEVVDGGRAGGPGRAQDALLLAVQQTEVRRGGVGREEEDGFLQSMG